MFYEVIPASVYRKGGRELTYRSDLELLPGHVVEIPIGPRLVTGVVQRRVKSVDFPTKPIRRLLYPLPIPEKLLKATIWLADYYLAALPEAINLLIPSALEARTAFDASCFTPMPPEMASVKPNPQSGVVPHSEVNVANLGFLAKEQRFFDGGIKLPLIQLNSAQKTALRELGEITEKNQVGSTALLRGVTGSGKTNIYLKMTADTLKKQKSAILLVPEIALTGQLVRVFKETFGERVVVVHSRQTLAERRRIWQKILETTTEWRCWPGDLAEVASKNGTEKAKNAPEIAENLPKDASKRTKNAEICHTPEPLIVIGPRSALLTPVANLGLIMIDEAHENAYFQENSPRYSALRLGSVLGKLWQSPCILGSATPNITDYYLAKKKNTLVELSQKAKDTALQPKIKVVDLKDRANFSKNRYFSNQLLTDIENNIQDGHQTLIFHNRRGSSPLTLCEECGWQALCPECYLPMTLHTDSFTLCCHLCGHEESVPKSCPHCHCTGVIHKGFGTKLLESELKKCFSGAKIARFDGDNKKGQSLADFYDEVKSGEIQILIGTQTLARGLDLPHLATVGIVQADAGLSLPDFATEERTFELLTQVCGRVGRGHLGVANVVVQAYQCDHPVIQTALEADFVKFADYLLKERKKQKMPPFTHLAKLSVTFKTEKTVLKKIQEAHQELSANSSLFVSPPMPAFHERVARGFTWQLVVKSGSRQELIKALAPYLKASGFAVVVDPPSLL